MSVKMRKVKKVGVSILLIFVFGAGFGGLTWAAEKPWEQIKWNEPVPMAERLSADRYILPKGWKEATEGVEEIVFGNSGGLAHDIATKMNIMKFEQLTGIKPVALEIPADLAYTKTLATLATRDGSVHLPLVNVAQFEMSTYAHGGWVEPIDILWSPDVLKLYSDGVEAFKVGDHWWGSFVTAIGKIEFYRPSWLRSAGVEVPDTWEELHTAAVKCDTWAKQELGETSYGIAFAGQGYDLASVLQDLVYAQDGQFYKNGRYQFGSPKFKNAVEFLISLFRKNITTQDVLNYNYADVGRLFGIGKAAFAIGVNTSYCMKYATEFPEVSGDWVALAPPPWSEKYPHGGGVVVNNSVVLNKFADDKHKAAAMLFIDYLRSAEATRNEVVVEANETFYLAHYKDPDVGNKVDWNLADKAADELNIPHPEHVSGLISADARGALMKHVVNEMFPPGFPQIMDKIAEAIGNAALGKISPEKACEEIQQRADQITS